MFDSKFASAKCLYLLIYGINQESNQIQYILANPNSPVPLRKEIVPISEFVRISEIALFLLRINNTNICNSQIWVILLFIPF